MAVFMVVLVVEKVAVNVVVAILKTKIIIIMPFIDALNI